MVDGIYVYWILYWVVFSKWRLLKFAWELINSTIIIKVWNAVAHVLKEEKWQNSQFTVLWIICYPWGCLCLSAKFDQYKEMKLNCPWEVNVLCLSLKIRQKRPVITFQYFSKLAFCFQRYWKQDRKYREIKFSEGPLCVTSINKKPCITVHML